MHDDIPLTVGRATRVLNERILPAVHPSSVPLDVAACTRRGIVVTNTPDVLTDTTADFAWTLLMATARRQGYSTPTEERGGRADACYGGPSS